MNWFETFVVKRIFKYISRKLDGYKTILGSVGVILSGVAFVLNGFATEEYEQAALGFGLIGKGISDIGIGGKLEKQKAVEEKMLTELERRRLLE